MNGSNQQGNRDKHTNASSLFLDIVKSTIRVTELPPTGKEVLLEYAAEFDFMFGQFYRMMRAHDMYQIYEYDRALEMHLAAIMDQLHYIFASLYTKILYHNYFGNRPVLENLMVSIEAQIAILRNVAAVCIEDNTYQNKIRMRMDKGQYSMDEIAGRLAVGLSVSNTGGLDLFSARSHEDRIVDKHTLMEALCSLTDMQRRRLLAYYIDDKTMERIAEEEGASTNAVSKSIMQATGKLKKYFFEQG